MKNKFKKLNIYLKSLFPVNLTQESYLEKKLKKLIKPKLIIILSDVNQTEILQKENIFAINLNRKNLLDRDKITKLKKKTNKSNQIIIQLNFIEFFSEINDKIDNLVNSLNQFLNLFSECLKRRVKIYLEFSEANRLIGYVDFFKNKKTPPFGLDITINQKNKSDQLKNITLSLQKLINSINYQITATIYNNTETMINKKLYLFGKNLSEINQPIRLLIEKFSEIRLPHTQLNLSGIYFVGNLEQEPGIFLKSIFTQAANNAKVFTSQKSYLINSNLNKQTLNIIKFKKTFFEALAPYKNLTYILLILSIIFSLSLTLTHIKKEYQTELKLGENALILARRLTQVSPESNPIEFIKELFSGSTKLLNYKASLLILPSSYKINREIHHYINPVFSNHLYRKSDTWLEKILSKEKLKLPSRITASLAYLSLQEPKRKTYLNNALCYFWQKNLSLKAIESCQHLKEWINPQFVLIKPAAINESIKILLKHSLAERVFAFFYIQSLMDIKNYIPFKRNQLFIDQSNSYSFIKIFTKNFTFKINNLLKQYVHDSRFLGIKDEALDLWDNWQQSQFDKLKKIAENLYWSKKIKGIHIKKFESTYQLEKLALEIKKHRSDLHQFLKILARYRPQDSLVAENELENFDYSALSDWLINISKKLTSVNQSSHPDKASLLLLHTTLNNPSQSPFGPAIELAQIAPLPLSTWIVEIYSNVWQLFALHYLNSLNQHWQNEIAYFYKEFIQDYYPIADSEFDLDLNDFQYFFGPDQLLDHFINKYLFDFLKPELNSLKLKSTFGLSLGLSQANMNFLNSINLIKLNYFDSKRAEPYLKFYIKPIELSSNTRSLKLMLAGQSLNYQHGPQFNHSIIWPNKKESSLVLTDFKNHRDELQQHGSWSIFRLLAAADELIKEQDGLRIYYAFPKQSCQFVINPSSQFVFNLSLFKNLNFPEKFSFSDTINGDNNE